MPSSPIRKLAPFADAAKKEGVQVYHLNIGQPDIETPHIMMEAVQQANLKVLEYTDSRGILSLRKKLAAYYISKGMDVNYEDVLITIGGSEAILFAFRSYLLKNLLQRHHFLWIEIGTLIIWIFLSSMTCFVINI